MRAVMQHRVWAPGRVNLIGEHIDYHNLPVLPMALHQRVTVDFAPRRDAVISVESDGFGIREFEWRSNLQPVAAGDWENYLRAAALAVSKKWGVGIGVNAAISSDLPAAAGLSSSSALIVAFAFCLLRANEKPATFEELMEVLPDGEQFVGTRGGGMDHAASLASRAGHATLVHFNPIRVSFIPIPTGWAFLIIDSGIKAEKSAAARDAYNRVREAGANGPHVPAEAQRVLDAATAMSQNDSSTFGRLMLASHASLRDNLHVSHPELDRIVEAAMSAGAIGARLTGAGFGGCAVALCSRDHVDRIHRELAEQWRVIEAESGDGALTSLNCE